MPKKKELWAPYGPPSTALMVIRHYRNRDVPERLTHTDLIQIGVGEGLIGRVWGSLEFLGLIEDDGVTTNSFRALREANDEEYENVFRGILEAAYSNIFGAIGDPADASEQQLRNAFHPYSPGAQRSRMITFFLGLCKEAGINLKIPVKESSVRDGQRRAPRVTQGGRRVIASRGGGQESDSRDGRLPFGLSEDDLAPLDETEFEEVWSALGKAYGKIIRAKARGRATETTEPEEQPGE
jgi:hypothetical protein